MLCDLFIIISLNPLCAWRASGEHLGILLACDPHLLLLGGSTLVVYCFLPILERSFQFIYTPLFPVDGFVGE